MTEPKRNGRPAVALRPATNRIVEEIARELDISKSEVVARAMDAYVQWRLDDPDMRRKETRPDRTA